MADIRMTEQAGTSYIEWSPIVAGAVLAGAISFVLLQFGTGIGLAAAAPLRGEGMDVAWRIVAIGIWLLWIQLMASLAGGYLAGRMRSPMPGSTPHEAEFRDGVHGLLVWATVMVAAIAGAGIVSAIAALAPPGSGSAVLQTQDMLRLEGNKGMIFAFGAAATSIVSAVAAWWAGTMGGEHRDKAVDLSRYVSFRRSILPNK